MHNPNPLPSVRRRDGSYDLMHEGDGSVRSMRETQGGGYVKEKVHDVC